MPLDDGRSFFRMLYSKGRICKLEKTLQLEVEAKNVCQSLGIEISPGESYYDFLCKLEEKEATITGNKEIDYSELGFDRNSIQDIFYIISYGLSNNISIFSIIKNTFVYMKKRFRILDIVAWFFMIKCVISICIIFISKKFNSVKFLLDYIPGPFLKLFLNYYDDYRESARIGEIESTVYFKPIENESDLESDNSDSKKSKLDKFNSKFPSTGIRGSGNIKKRTSITSSNKRYSNENYKEIKSDLDLGDNMSKAKKTRKLVSKILENRDVKSKNFYNNFYIVCCKIFSYKINDKDPLKKNIEEYLELIRKDKNKPKVIGFPDHNNAILSIDNWVPPTKDQWSGNIIISKSFNPKNYKFWENRPNQFANMNNETLKAHIYDQKCSPLNDLSGAEGTAFQTYLNIYDNILNLDKKHPKYIQILKHEIYNSILHPSLFEMEDDSNSSIIENIKYDYAKIVELSKKVFTKDEPLGFYDEKYIKILRTDWYPPSKDLWPWEIILPNFSNKEDSDHFYDEKFFKNWENRQQEYKNLNTKNIREFLHTQEKNNTIYNTGKDGILKKIDDYYVIDYDLDAIIAEQNKIQNSKIKSTISSVTNLISKTSGFISGFFGGSKNS